MLMEFILTKASYLPNGKFDGKILGYDFQNVEDNSLRHIVVGIAEPFNEWKNEYQLTDDEMIKFILKVIEFDLVKLQFKDEWHNFKIFSDSKPIIDFEYKDYDLNSYKLMC